ncbi:MAG: hypothetical protein J7M40_18775 [Planctomycetes bacterium]|nr:hypothetical protein [Planctomycetota bacterium]
MRIWEHIESINLKDVQGVYSGPEGRLWELIMGEQIHWRTKSILFLAMPAIAGSVG